MLFSAMEREVDSLGMGVLSDGTPYLNQRGLAALCGVKNAHIGTISSQWNENPEKPRILSIKSLLNEDGFECPDLPHIEVNHAGRTHYCYPVDVCLAVLQYYAFEAGSNCQPEARSNFRRLAGSKLTEEIYRQVGYNPNSEQNKAMVAWHERIALNHKSSPDGYFCIFNEAHTVIYELIHAGVDVGPSIIPDLSIGIHWSKYWKDNRLEDQYGASGDYPHRYPDSHPQAKSNPQTAKCYPLAALGAYRGWLQETYVNGGKLGKYLKTKEKILPSGVVQRALEKIIPKSLS